jgi:uncharacterized damage-inducible protein DinB
MPLIQPFDLLLTHDRWATRNVLLACEPLSGEQFHRKFEMGFGSLHAILTHVLSATIGWSKNLERSVTTARPDADGVQRTPTELLALHTVIYDEFESIARAHPLDDTITISRNNITLTIPRGVAVTHLTTHNMHHRAQCVNMLRHVGVSPLPFTSVIEWQRITGNA